MMRPFLAIAVSAALAATLGGLTMAPALAQDWVKPDTVVVFREPPTAAELRQLLAPGAQASAAARNLPRRTSRSITFEDPAAAPQQVQAPTASAPQPEPPPAQTVAIALLVPFAVNSAAISPPARVWLDEVGRLMVQDTSLSLNLSGHADRSGSDAVNDPLSWRRAEAVREYLRANFGVSPARIQVRGFGAHQPLPGADPFDPLNRRVQVARL